MVRRIFLFLGAIAVVGICVGFGSVKAMEYFLVRELNNTLAHIPASYKFSVHEIAGDFFDSSVTLKQVSFTLSDGETPTAVSMDSITLQGLSFPDDTAGQTMHADMLMIAGLKTVIGDTITTTDYSEISGFKANLPTLAANWGVSSQVFGSLFEALAKQCVKDASMLDDALWQSNKTKELFFAERFISKGDRIRRTRGGSLLEIFLGSSELREIAETSNGPLMIKDIWAEFDGSRFMSLAEISFDATLLPPESEVGFDREIPLGQNPFHGDFHLKKGAVKGLKLTIDTPNGKPLPISLAHAGVHFVFTDKQQQVSLSVDRLAMEKRILSISGDIPEQSEIIALLPDTLVFNGQMDLTISVLQKGGTTLLLSPAMLGIEKMGAITLTVDMTNLLPTKKDPSVVLIDMSLMDEGISEFCFAAFGMLTGTDPGTLRQSVCAFLTAAPAALSEPLTELRDNILNFLEKPGASLRITIAPATPTPLGVLEKMIELNPESAGISSTLTRPGRMRDKQP